MHEHAVAARVCADECASGLGELDHWGVVGVDDPQRVWAIAGRGRVLDGGVEELLAVALTSLAMVDKDGADVLRPGEVVRVMDDGADDLIAVNRQEDVTRRFVEVRTGTRSEDEVRDLGYPRIGLAAHRSVRVRTSSRSSSRNDDLNCGGTGSSAWLIKRTSSSTGVGS